MAGKRKYPGVYATSDGKWRATWRTSNGRQQMKRGFESAIAAHKYRTKMLVKADEGELVAGPGTFAEFFDRWLRGRKPYLEDRTWSGYETVGRLQLKPFFGAKKLTKIDRDDVREFTAQLVDADGLKPKTINNCLTILHAAFEDAVDDGLLAKNPARGRKGAKGRGIKLPYEKPEMDFLRLYEIPTYIAAAPDEYRVIAELLIGTGMRCSEVCALRVRHVDFDRGHVLVARQRKGDGEGGTKGDKIDRVEIGDRLVGILRDHLAREAEHRAVGPDDHVFMRPTREDARATAAGTPYDRHRIYDLHKLTAAKLGRDTLRAHDLRHTAAASWLACGLPLMYVQRQLRHRQYQTTVDEYGHLEESFMRDAPARVEAAIWQGELEPASVD